MLYFEKSWDRTTEHTLLLLCSEAILNWKLETTLDYIWKIYRSPPTFFQFPAVLMPGNLKLKCIQNGI